MTGCYYCKDEGHFRADCLLLAKRPGRLSSLLLMYANKMLWLVVDSGIIVN